jgi:hypothetical protein
MDADPSRKEWVEDEADPKFCVGVDTTTTAEVTSPATTVTEAATTIPSTEATTAQVTTTEIPDLVY